MSERVYLCGIGGIGMANFACLLKEAEFDVDGSDGAIYEPAASILRSAGIVPRIPYAAENVPLDRTCHIVIGNAQSRGHVEVEAMLEAGLELHSFPELLHRRILQGRHVVVVAGTHGKSTTTACISFLLDRLGAKPGFLTGALPRDFPTGATLGGPKSPFVLEGDEYDSAFFDKRSKFLHYFPLTLVLGPVEFDHADIFSSEEEMLLSFRRLLNTLPRNGLLIYAADSPAACELAKHAPCHGISVGKSNNSDWQLLNNREMLEFRDSDGLTHQFKFGGFGEHNRMNALMSVVAAVSMGFPVEKAGETLAGFHGIRRRLEVLHQSNRLVVIDDFAHHPTAIAAALQAVREEFPQHRIIAVFEPRSNTMVRNIFQDRLPASFTEADHVIMGAIHRADRIPPEQRLSPEILKAALAAKHIPFDIHPNTDIPTAIQRILDSKPTVVLFMSNGSFDGAATKLMDCCM